MSLDLRKFDTPRFIISALVLAMTSCHRKIITAIQSTLLLIFQHFNELFFSRNSRSYSRKKTSSRTLKHPAPFDADENRLERHNKKMHSELLLLHISAEKSAMSERTNTCRFLHTSTFGSLVTTFVFRRHLFIRSGEYKHGERLKNARVLHHTTTALHRARNILSIFIAFPPNKKTTLFISILALLVITQKIVPQRSFVYCSSRPARYKLCKNFYFSLFLPLFFWILLNDIRVLMKN